MRVATVLRSTEVNPVFRDLLLLCWGDWGRLCGQHAVPTVAPGQSGHLRRTQQSKSNVLITLWNLRHRMFSTFDLCRWFPDHHHIFTIPPHGHRLTTTRPPRYHHRSSHRITTITPFPPPPTRPTALSCSSNTTTTTATTCATIVISTTTLPPPP